MCHPDRMVVGRGVLIAPQVFEAVHNARVLVICHGAVGTARPTLNQVALSNSPAFFFVSALVEFSTTV